MAKATLRRSKKTRKNIPEAIISITATLNNTHVVVSDLAGQVLTWSTGGVGDVASPGIVVCGTARSSMP